jgi:hypothetical protein
MFDWVQPLLDAMNAALKEGAALSVLLGLAGAILGTQFVKRLEVFPSKKWLIRGGLALPLGFMATFFTWPVHTINGVRIVLAVVVGLAAPLVYQGVTYLIYLKWPQLEKHLSAQPGQP